jgi:hypothetical protein
MVTKSEKDLPFKMGKQRHSRCSRDAIPRLSKDRNE